MIIIFLRLGDGVDFCLSGSKTEKKFPPEEDAIISYTLCYLEILNQIQMKIKNNLFV